jgi:hypothetical protein
MVANIASDDALILPHRANPAGLNFRERQPRGKLSTVSSRRSPRSVLTRKPRQPQNPRQGQRKGQKS